MDIIVWTSDERVTAIPILDGIPFWVRSIRILDRETGEMLDHYEADDEKSIRL